MCLLTDLSTDLIISTLYDDRWFFLICVNWLMKPAYTTLRFPHHVFWCLHASDSIIAPAKPANVRQRILRGLECRRVLAIKPLKLAQSATVDGAFPGCRFARRRRSHHPSKLRPTNLSTHRATRLQRRKMLFSPRVATSNYYSVGSDPWLLKQRLQLHFLFYVIQRSHPYCLSLRLSGVDNSAMCSHAWLKNDIVGLHYWQSATVE